jgi:hypothetical protein
MRFALSCLVLLAAAPRARAEPWPTALTRRPLVLRRAMCEAAVAGEANVAPRRTGEPASLAPDLHCGVTARATLGVIHSARAHSLIDSGDGLCLSGDGRGGCPRVYDNAGLDALYDLTGPDHAAALAARARLVARSFEPFKPSLRLGALVRIGHGAALLLDPHVSFALAASELGNRDFVSLPVRGQLDLGSRLTVELVTGVRGELVGFDEKLAIPVGAALSLAIGDRVDLALEAAFPKLLGPRNTFKQRHAALTLTVRVETATSPPSAASYTAD